MVLLIFFYTILGLFFSIFFIIYRKLIRSQKYFYDTFRDQGISCEPFVPLLGQLPDIRHASENDSGLNYRMELARKHGYVYVTAFGPSIHLVVIELDMLADILGRSHAPHFGKPTDTEKFFKPLIGIHNLLVSEGSEHERARKMLNPAFHFVKLQSMVSIMVDQTNRAINELLVLSTERQVIDLQIELNAFTLAIIASSAFGKGFETMANAKKIVCRAFTESLEAINYRATSLSASDDILDLLLSVVDSGGQPFTDQEIKDQALTFVLAGHETTGNLMTWAMYVLMTNEQVLQACRDEVDRILPNGIELTHEHMNELVVCEAVLQETLRLYPPAPFISRRCIREHGIGSEGHGQIPIPVGTIILLNIDILHRREEYWSRPNEFNYSRWMRDPVTGLKPKLTHPFCYLPFAAGPRNCIGQNFALLEAKVMLAMLVQRCNFELEPGQKIVPDIRLTMRPKYGLRVRVTQRL